MKHVIASHAKRKNDILVAGKQSGAGVCHFYVGGNNSEFVQMASEGLTPFWSELQGMGYTLPYSIIFWEENWGVIRKLYY